MNWLTNSLADNIKGGPTTGLFRFRTAEKNMIKKILLATLAIVPALGAAEETRWKYFGAAEDERFKIYIDYTTMKRTGEIVKAWVLYDFRDEQVEGPDRFFSSVARREYNCGEGEVLMRQLNQYGGNMGSGKIVYSGAHDGKWTLASPNSIAEAILLHVCKPTTDRTKRGGNR